ncbi:MAG: hypothetical protein IT269_09755 [Saprospiraceae bacterium]|nr:hypothetical protein [Saprospiraceae bacterium]
MRLAFTIVFFFTLSLFSLHAQCPAFQLADLQSAQRGGQGSIEVLGFDLTKENAANLRYDRCWITRSNGKELYSQVIWLNKQTGNITFLTNDETAFLNLRRQIEERNGSTATLGQSDFYVGRVFKYEFFRQNLDGLEYFATSIKPK